MSPSSANNYVQEASQSRWKSYFHSSKRVLKSIGANSLEFTGTALQIASEITTFVAGMGFFIAPPLKKVYAELQGKNMKYSVNGHGELCVDNRNTALFPTNTSSLLAPNVSLFYDIPTKNPCHKVTNEPLLSSNILFSLPFPESLFAASVLLFSLGCSGLVVASALKRYGASLHVVNKEMPPSEKQVTEAEKMNRATALIATLFLISSRTAAIYATTTISMTMTLRNVPSILEDFSIPSSKEFTYQIEDNSFNFAPALANNTLITVISLTMHFITSIDFSELRNAATIGSKKIDSYDYNIALVMAVVALILGHAALKIQQQNDRYTDTLLRHKHAQELGDARILAEQRQDPNIITDIENALSVINPNRMFVATQDVQDDTLSVISIDEIKLEV